MIERVALVEIEADGGRRAGGKDAEPLFRKSEHMGCVVANADLLPEHQSTSRER